MADQQQRSSNVDLSQVERKPKRGRSGTSLPACGACKHSKKKCKDDCPFAPYFSSDKGQEDFALVQEVYGAQNVAKRLKFVVDEEQGHQLMASILFEARQRAKHPVHGCLFRIHELEQQVAQMKIEMAEKEKEVAQKEKELADVKRQNQLTNPETSYASFLKQKQQPPLQSNINLALQPSFSNNSTFCTNFTNMNSLNPDFGHLSQQITSLTHNLEPLQFSRLPHYEQENMIPRVFNNDLNLPIQPPYYNNPSPCTNFMNITSSNLGFDQLAMQTTTSTQNLEPLPYSSLVELEGGNSVPQLFNNETSYLIP